MKEYIIVVLFLFGLEISIIAQTDTFFMYGDGFRYIKKENGYEMIMLPEQHGLDYNYYADKVSLGSGCLLLLGMGLAYAKFKKQV